MTNQLSPPQLRILTYITGFVRSNGYAPTVREICTGVGISSTSVVDYHLGKLQELGFFRRTPHISRSIVLDMERVGDVLAEVVA